MGPDEGGCITKEHKKRFGGVGGCTRDLDVGDGVTGVHICQRSSNYISNRCSLPYIEYTLVKLKILS